MAYAYPRQDKTRQDKTRQTNYGLLKFGFVKKTTSLLVIFSLIFTQVFGIFTPLVYAASTPWTQTDWSGGVGASTTNQYSAASSTDATTTSGQVTLTNTEKFSNTGFESNLTNWNTGAQPDSISGLQLWLKADAITGLSDGDNVTTWADSSSSGNNPTQPTTANKPLYKTNIINGQPTVRFDGSNDNMTMTAPISGANSTIFFVIRLTKTTAENYLLGRNDTSPTTLLGWDEDGFGLRVYSTSGGYASSLKRTAVINTNRIVTSSISSNTVTFYIDGSVQSGTVGIGSNFTPNQLGAYVSGRNFGGDIAEVVIYNSTLSSSNRQSVEAYLQGKYAISSGNATLTRDTATTYNSSAGSAKLVNGSSAQNFTQSVNVGDTNTYNLSTYAYTDGSAVTSSDVELLYNGATISTTYTSVGSGWYKLTGTLTGANASRTYGVQIKANKTVYVDDFSLNNYASSGTLTSSIFDSGQGSNWGTLTYTATTPTNTTVTVKARTSNDSGMSGATAFSSCNAITSATDISSNNCVTDTHRYIQYQLALANSSTEVTPTFSDISTTFAVSDADAPSISLTALTPDPNSDTTPTLSGTATESVGTVSNVQFQMDSTSGSWSSCTASDGSFNSASEAFSCTPSSLSDGSHTMYVRATDSNSNTTASASYASDAFTIDATAPVSISLDSPGDNSYTNSERPSYKWKATTDATAGLSKYVLEIDNPSIGSSQPSGDFTIDNVPTSRTTDYETNKYTIKYENFSDSDSTNNYISVYTKSHSDWGTSENDGKLREGRISWKVKAVDNASNETSSSRTIFVDRSNPNVEFTQINSTSFSSSGISTTDKTPTIFGKITDPLSGAENVQTKQDENGPKVASGPKQVEIKIEKKEGLLNTLILTSTINMDSPYYSCETTNQTIDNSKHKCDKYLPFSFTPKEELSQGSYIVTITGKDKADNSFTSTSFTLNITSLFKITTSEEKKIIEEEIEELPEEEQQKIQENLEITKSTEEVPVSAIEKAGENISKTSNNIIQGTGNLITTVFTGVGNGTTFTASVIGNSIAFTFNTIGSGLAFTREHVGNGIGFVFTKTGEGLAFTGNGIGSGISNTSQTIGNGYSNLANSAPGFTKNILLTVGNGVSTVGTGIGNGFSAVGTTTQTIADGAGKMIGTTTNTIRQGLNNTKNATGNTIANIVFGVGQKTDDVSHGLGTAIIKFGYLFVPEPTRITNVKVAKSTPTSMTITWETNHPANGKVNYGLTADYGQDVQSDKRINSHEFTVTGLKPNTTYFYEVMSQNRNYVYDANHTFTTPKE